MNRKKKSFSQHYKEMTTWKSRHKEKIKKYLLANKKKTLLTKKKKALIVKSEASYGDTQWKTRAEE
jgi:hypothetical protein